jgi:hypothetical protein
MKKSSAFVSALTAVALAGLLFLPKAKADIMYDFTVPLTEGTVTGTLTGTLDLPFVNAGGSGTGAASSLVLTSFPAGLGALAGGDVVTNWANQVTDIFTVTNGVITSDQFFATTGTADPADVFVLNSTDAVCGTIGAFSCAPLDNELHTAANLFGFNENGLAGVTFTPVSVVPAPPIGRGLPVLLAVGGILFGAKILERTKKRRSLGAAIPHVAT